MRKSKIALLLAGGTGTRLNILASLRAKPAVPFGGIYRLIDFTLSNLMHSNIEVVGVLTQYKPFSLMNHIESGQAWDFVGRMRTIEILPPHTGEKASDWYKGTADAVYQNLNFIEDYSPDLILIVSGDHIYKMDYNEMIQFHIAKNAHATIGLIDVPIREASNFGIAYVDTNNKITGFEEKPKVPKNNLASMGVYLFDRKIFIKRLKETCEQGGRDFGRDLLPKIIFMNRVFGYTFKGYWRDVGTIQAYWEANMDILRTKSGLDLNQWQVRTNQSEKGRPGERPASYIGKRARIKNSTISRGCQVEGEIVNSILAPGVIVKKGATIKNSIVFHDGVINEGCHLELAIIDKNFKLGTRSKVGCSKDVIPNRQFPTHLYTGITLIGKNVSVPQGIIIGKNCLIYPEVKATNFKKKTIDSGATLEKY